MGYRFKPFDLSNVTACREHFEKADVVFHCAARSSPWGVYEDFYNANVLEMMVYYNIPKLVHVSTLSIYFDFSDQRAVQENYRPKQFVNHYAKTKYEAELLVLSSNVDATIIRPRGIFGEYDDVFMPRLERIVQKGFLPLIKNRDTLVNITYVGNVVYAMYLAATKELPDKSVFNISNDEPMQISTFLTMVMKIVGKEVKYKKINYKIMMHMEIFLEFIAKIRMKHAPMLTKYSIGFIAYNQTLDLKKSKEILGYVPKFTIAEGLDRYVKSKDLKYTV